MNIDHLVKQSIRTLVRQKSTFADRNSYLRLDKNERLLEFDPKLFEEFKRDLTSNDFSAYHEISPLKEKLAGYLNVDQNQVFLAAGSDLAIKAIFEVFVENGDNVVLHAPCYAMYRVYADMFGAEQRVVSVNAQWEIDFDEMYSAIDTNTKVLFVENPNGFIGTKPTQSQLRQCANSLLERNVLFVIDEAYFYIENRISLANALIAEFPNVIVSQTLSKGHGLAGARVGFLIGHNNIISNLEKVSPMYEISSLSARAATWVLDNEQLLSEYQHTIIESKNYHKDKLADLDVPYKDTHANFMVLYLPDEGRSRNLQLELQKRKIIIRRPFEESLLTGWIRICVGTLDDSKIFCDQLTEIIS